VVNGNRYKVIDIYNIKGRYKGGAQQGVEVVQMNQVNLGWVPHRWVGTWCWWLST